ncbi:MAG: low molecular weight protein-tyrosine-phosphatase [Pseudomonadota bacterium]
MDETQPRKVGVLFVCMGNICRSPTAEATFRRHIDAYGAAALFDIDSAGTHAYHVGHAPDDRSVAVAQTRGVSMQGMKARRVEEADFFRFDYIVAMDIDNLGKLERMQPDGGRAQLSLLLEHDPDGQGREVPDPYYGGQRGFELVFDWVDQATGVLARKLAG